MTHHVSTHLTETVKKPVLSALQHVQLLYIMPIYHTLLLFLFGCNCANIQCYYDITIYTFSAANEQGFEASGRQEDTQQKQLQTFTY